jgi:cysteine desulfurase
MKSDQDTCSQLKNLFLDELKTAISEIEINGSLKERITDNLNIRIPGIDSEQLIANVPEVAFSTGSACTSGQIETSHVLRAMGLDDKKARESFRISFNAALTKNQILDATNFIIRGCSKLRNI